MDNLRYAMDMTTNLLADARQYLLLSLRGKHNGFESYHPWRRSWEFAVLHSLHVEQYVLKILAREQHALSDTETLLLQLAAILHDIARLEQREMHAVQGAGIAKSWLQSYCNDLLMPGEIERVVELISTHSDKAGAEPDFSKAVLKDADTLDEIGMMSIFMASNWLDKASPFFFHHLRQRLVDFELAFCDEKLMLLNTHGAREILTEKRAFIEHFITQLDDELQSDPQIEGLLFEGSKNDSRSGLQVDLC